MAPWEETEGPENDTALEHGAAICSWTGGSLQLTPGRRCPARQREGVPESTRRIIKEESTSGLRRLAADVLTEGTLVETPT